MKSKMAKLKLHLYKQKAVAFFTSRGGRVPTWINNVMKEKQNFSRNLVHEKELLAFELLKNFTGKLDILLTSITNKFWKKKKSKEKQRKSI